MHDDELKQAWAALQAQRRAANVSSGTPSPEAIDAALDGSLSSDERERVLDATLAQGRSDELRLLHTMRQAAAESTRTTAAVRAWPRWWPTAAAAALVLAIGVPTWQSQRARTAGTADSATFRSGVPDDVQLIAPASGTAWPSASGDTLRVSWHAVPTATSYQVDLLDAGGQVMATQSFKGDTTALLSAPDAGPDGAPAGWWVSASLADGRRVRSELRLLEPHRP
jgi:hypothetical protein